MRLVKHTIAFKAFRTRRENRGKYHLVSFGGEGAISQFWGHSILLGAFANRRGERGKREWGAPWGLVACAYRPASRSHADRRATTKGRPFVRAARCPTGWALARFLPLRAAGAPPPLRREAHRAGCELTSSRLQNVLTNRLVRTLEFAGFAPTSVALRHSTANSVGLEVQEFAGSCSISDMRFSRLGSATHDPRDACFPIPTAQSHIADRIHGTPRRNPRPAPCERSSGDVRLPSPPSPPARSPAKE